MTEKDSFILHKDSLKVLDKMSDLQVARLFRAIKDYHEGKKPVLDELLSLVFVSFENQFERDARKYADRYEQNRNNAKKGCRSRSLPVAADNDPDMNLYLIMHLILIIKTLKGKKDFIRHAKTNRPSPNTIVLF